MLRKINLTGMKTWKLNIACVLVMLGLFGITLNVNSQETKPDKQSRKEAKKAQMIANYHVLDSLLSVGRYVLEANFLQSKYGTMVAVSSTLNFIRVEGPKGVLQTGSDLRQGYNGVGGVTAEGTINDYKIEHDLKNLTCTVTFNLLTDIGTYTIILNVSADNNAYATISGSTSGKLTWRGQLQSIEGTRTYKGFKTI